MSHSEQPPQRHVFRVDTSSYSFNQDACCTKRFGKFNRDMYMEDIWPSYRLPPVPLSLTTRAVINVPWKLNLRPLAVRRTDR